jgi:hypothetical protein
MACCFAVQAGLIWKVQTTGSKSAGIGATAGQCAVDILIGSSILTLRSTVLFVYMGLFTTGFQAVVWVYPSEILSLRLRQKGSAVATAVNWICNFAIVEMTPSALEAIGYK